MKLTKWLYFVAVICFVVACAATPTSESTGEYLDSSAITAKIKAKLVDKLGTKGFSIKVKTYKDQVQLSGFVSSNRTKMIAGQIAESVGDVHTVRNDIIVKSSIE
ncbi:BON domain-containing protein [Legionella sp. W05-934-2]|jgi:osmotically-inducible protein OsmY|uniref:BON domain-containing protein n=1 Tax=Legionella sp. W05-934-2 TaxID=1198649 RepID=UPI003462195B